MIVAPTTQERPVPLARFGRRPSCLGSAATVIVFAVLSGIFRFFYYSKLPTIYVALWRKARRLPQKR